MILTEHTHDQIVLEFEYLTEGFFYIFSGSIWLLFWHSFLRQAFSTEWIIWLPWGVGLVLILAGIYLFTLRKTIVFSKRSQTLSFLNRSITGFRTQEYKLEQVAKLKVYRYSNQRYYYDLYLELTYPSKAKTIYLDTFADVDELIQQGELITTFLGIDLFWCNPPRHRK